MLFYNYGSRNHNGSVIVEITGKGGFELYLFGGFNARGISRNLKNLFLEKDKWSIGKRSEL